MMKINSWCVIEILKFKVSLYLLLWSFASSSAISADAWDGLFSCIRISVSFSVWSLADTNTCCCKLHLTVSACWILQTFSVNIFEPGNHETPTLAVFLGTEFGCRSAAIGCLNREEEVGSCLFTATVATFLQANTCSDTHTPTHTPTYTHTLSHTLTHTHTNTPTYTLSHSLSHTHSQ